MIGFVESTTNIILNKKLCTVLSAITKILNHCAAFYKTKLYSTSNLAVCIMSLTVERVVCQKKKPLFHGRSHSAAA